MTLLFDVTAAILGLVIGSFLNVCIYRMPLGLSVANPKRSFCPACGKMIPWYENLPVVSWLWLRGKCSTCGTPISVRYLLVEVLTGCVFLALWLKFGLPLAPAYAVFLCLLIVATFIDIEHFIIPDEITWGGAIAGLLLSVAIPGLQGVSVWWQAGLLSAGGAALGFGLLWLVVELGKLAFGRKRDVFQPPQDFRWVRDGDRADIFLGEEKLPWEEIFSRERDVLVLEVVSPIKVGDREVEGNRVEFRYNLLKAGEETIDLDTLDEVSGQASAVTIPREAMGFGDVKFIACIGAFLGWDAVLFTLFASSIIGCVAGLAGIFLARDRSGARIPFGPFLALGGVLWLCGGRELTALYFANLGLGR